MTAQTTPPVELPSKIQPAMKRTIKKAALVLGAVSIQSSASATLIAGSDFSDAAVFGRAGGAYDIVNTDDLNVADGISVGPWTFSNGNGFSSWADGGARPGMPTDQVTKIDGISNDPLPILGGDTSGFGSVSFQIDVPAGTQLDLTSVNFYWRMATGGATQERWVGFNTSLDSGLTFVEVGPARPEVVNTTIDLSDPRFQGLTDTSVTFNWYAGGAGSGDIDFDLPTVNGNVSVIPEPSAVALFGLAGLAAFMRRRR